MLPRAVASKFKLKLNKVPHIHKQALKVTKTHLYLVNSFTLLWNYRTSKRARLIRSSIQGILLALDIEDSCRQRPCTKRVENKIKATKNISFDKYCTQILTFKLFTLQVSFSHSSSNVYVQWPSTFWAEKLGTMTRHFLSRNKKNSTWWSSMFRSSISMEVPSLLVWLRTALPCSRLRFIRTASNSSLASWIWQIKNVCYDNNMITEIIKILQD